jgi:hypothetical protein
MLEHEQTGVGRGLRHAALTVLSSVWAWTQAAGIDVADGNVLLALSETGDVGAAAVSTRSGLPLDVVYLALHRLTDRGYAIEEHRHHRLTAAGHRLVADFDRVTASLSITETKGMS